MKKKKQNYEKQPIKTSVIQRRNFYYNPDFPETRCNNRVNYCESYWKRGTLVLLPTWDCFKKFMSLVEPRYSSACYRTVIAKMDAICAKKKTEIISKLNRYNYSVALDEWTGCNR